MSEKENKENLAEVAKYAGRLFKVLTESGIMTEEAMIKSSISVAWDTIKQIEKSTSAMIGGKVVRISNCIMVIDENGTRAFHREEEKE